MRTQKELNQFIVLRSNGWSLARISKHLNIPKTTLFRWEEKNADSIHLLKYVQIEKIQEQYVPSYEEQLKDTHEHLAKIQSVLKKRDYSLISSEFLLQMNFQLQNRLDKIRRQVPLSPPQFDNPTESLPPIGCVTKDETFPQEGDSSDPDPTIEGEPDSSSNGRASVPASQALNGTRHKETSSSVVPPLGAPSNGNHRPNGNSQLNDNGHARSSVNSVSSVPSVFKNQNGTFRNENPRGSKTDHCKSTTSNTQNGTTVPFRKEKNE